MNSLRKLKKLLKMNNKYETAYKHVRIGWFGIIVTAIAVVLYENIF